MAASFLIGAAFGGGGARVTILGLRSRRWRLGLRSRAAAAQPKTQQRGLRHVRVEVPGRRRVRLPRRRLGELRADAAARLRAEVARQLRADVPAHRVGGPAARGRADAPRQLLRVASLPRPPPPPAGLPRFIALRSRRPPTPRCCRASRAQVPSPLVVWRALTLVSRNKPLLFFWCGTSVASPPGALNLLPAHARCAAFASVLP